MNVFRPDTNLKIFLLAFCVVFFSLTAAGSAQQAVQDDQPPEPVLPAPIEAVLFAQPFRLETGYMTWPPDTPPVTSGLIVVFRADPALTIPREAPTPIL
jgi:hypothetical protein